MKRALDILGAALGLVVLSPLLAIIATTILLFMGTPIIFRQTRPGKDERPFRIYKFRTMTECRDCHEELLPDEQRLTVLGRFLRSTSLDELPELWNVLKGDMSLVGPRPLLMEYLDLYSTRQARRHEVKPGMTGLAQISGRNELAWEEKLELDVQYVERQTLWLDIKILIKTVGRVLRREGVTAQGHVTAPKYEGSSETIPRDPDTPRGRRTLE